MPARRRVRVGEDQRPVTTIDEGPLPDVCDCPRLEAEEWQDAENDWSDIAFERGHIPAIAGVPFGYNSIRAKLTARAAKAGVGVPEDPMLLLGAGRTWRPVLLEVETPEEGNRAKLYRPGGLAYTRLAFAPPGKVKAAFEDTRQRATRRYGRKPDRMWLWYLTCRVCSEERNFETLIVAWYRAAGAGRA